ncbi:MAG: thioredoxin domain-containing protein [Ancalomicrobiaceae bacterium]|nr:thioredoxin domain-containing protein [Ancalomicrobiaceae bacterium]
MLASRRHFLNLSLAGAGTAATLALAACGSDANAVDAKELMKPGSLPEMEMGKSDAPVTVIEYSSLGCPHCAEFEKDVFPHLKKTYIDTGKVRFISRDFPLDQVAAAAAMLARCAPKDKYFDMIGLFYDKQEVWHVTENPTDALFNLVKQTGFTRESFETCLKDQALLDGITAQRQRGAEVFKIEGTPTFFVNAKRADNFQTIADVDKTLSSYLGS